MERDFMGLNYKDPIVIKEEFVEGGCEDSGFARSSGIPWPWSNEPSALPQFISLKCEQDEKSSKIKYDILASHAYMAKSGSEMFEVMHKQQSTDIQNWPSSNPVDDVTMYPFSMMSRFLKPHFMGSCQNFGGANMKQQFLGGISAPPIIPPSAASVAGTTEQWNNYKASSTSAQLTIFYGGTVNVFDDITPEKAQAIIFLAGNGGVPSNMAQSKFHMIPAPDRVLVNQSINMPLSSSLPNPMSDPSCPGDPSGIPLANNDDVMVSKTAGMSTRVVNKVELPRVVLPIRSAAASSMISSAVPQARKASLTRFLEKRKERSTNAAPYDLNKKITADCATPESKDFGLSATSGVYSSPVSISKRD